MGIDLSTVLLGLRSISKIYMDGQVGTVSQNYTGNAESTLPGCFVAFANASQ